MQNRGFGWHSQIKEDNDIRKLIWHAYIAEVTQRLKAGVKVNLIDQSQSIIHMVAQCTEPLDLYDFIETLQQIGCSDKDIIKYALPKDYKQFVMKEMKEGLFNGIAKVIDPNVGLKLCNAALNPLHPVGFIIKLSRRPKEWGESHDIQDELNKLCQQFKARMSKRIDDANQTEPSADVELKSIVVIPKQLQKDEVVAEGEKWQAPELSNEDKLMQAITRNDDAAEVKRLLALETNIHKYHTRRAMEKGFGFAYEYAVIYGNVQIIEAFLKSNQATSQMRESMITLMCKKMQVLIKNAKPNDLVQILDVLVKHYKPNYIKACMQHNMGKYMSSNFKEALIRAAMQNNPDNAKEAMDNPNHPLNYLLQLSESHYHNKNSTRQILAVVQAAPAVPQQREAERVVERAPVPAHMYRQVTVNPLLSIVLESDQYDSFLRVPGMF